MKVMVVRPGAAWAVADVARGWVNALHALGVDVIDFRWDRVCGFHMARRPMLTTNECAAIAADALVAKVYADKPDVLLVICGHEIPPPVYQLLRARGQRVVLVHTESPYEDDRIASMHWCADVHLVNDPLGAEAINRAANVEPGSEVAFYAHHCYDPTVHYDAGLKRDLPFLFVGSGFGGRREFFEQMRWPKGVRPVLAGTWRGNGRFRRDPLRRFVPADWPSPLDNEQTAQAYRHTAVSLNLYRLDHLEREELAVGWAMGPREVELAACGVFFLRMPRPEGDALFPMLPTFDSVAEASDLLAWWWQHPDLMREAAAEARGAVAERTFTNLARGLLGLLEQHSPCAAA